MERRGKNTESCKGPYTCYKVMGTIIDHSRTEPVQIYADSAEFETYHGAVSTRMLPVIYDHPSFTVILLFMTSSILNVKCQNGVSSCSHKGQVVMNRVDLQH